MGLFRTSVLSAVTSVLSVCGATAQPAQFSIQELTIEGTTHVAAIGLNDHGTIVGYYLDGKGVQHGFVLAEGVTTLLAPLVIGGISMPAIPTGIDLNGDVVGYAGTYGFRWLNGAYVTNGTVQLAAGGLNPGRIGDRGTAVYSAGTFARPINVVGTPGAYVTLDPSPYVGPVLSVNDKGMFAGTANMANSYSVFYGRPGHLRFLQPGPGVQSLRGGYINGYGTIAGTATSSSGGESIFSYSGGTYTQTFGPPSGQAFTVTGLNLSGHIVGTYVDNTGQHAFLVGGSSAVNTFSQIGSFLPNQNVFVTINDNGVILITGIPTGGDQMTHAYRVVCRGSGC
jgi:hypothetical protein